MALREDLLHVAEDDRQRLLQWARREPATGLGLRASIVLLAARGLPSAAVARQLNTTRQTVITWTDRYRDEGVTGLRDRVRPGRRRALDGAEVVLRTLLTRPYGRPHTTWSSRTLAAELKVSNGTIANVWRRWQLRPAEIHDFRLPMSPGLSAHVVDVVGLYCGGEDAAVVVRVDERPHRRDPQRSAVPSRFAPFDAAELRAALAAMAGHRDQWPDRTWWCLPRFLGELGGRYPGVQLHAVLGGGSRLPLPPPRVPAGGRLHLHVAADDPGWVELAVVMIGAAESRRLDRFPDHLVAHLPGALRSAQRAALIARDQGGAFCWIRGTGAHRQETYCTNFATAKSGP